MSTAFWNSLEVMRTAPQRVLLSAWQVRRNRGSLWFSVLVGALPACVPIAVWLFPRENTSLRIIIAAGVIGITLVAVWARLVFNVLLQNHPHTARLLPAQVQVLRSTLWATGALLCTVSTLLSWLAGGPVLAMAAGTAVGLAWFALSLRLWFGFVAFYGSLPFLWVARGDFDSAAWLWHSAPEALTLLAFVLAGLALRSVVMTGDARHKRSHARLQLISAGMQGQLPGNLAQLTEAAQSDFGLTLGNSVYAKCLGRVIAQPHPNVGVRLALGLGPRVYWTVVADQAMVLTLVALVVLAVQCFPNWKYGHGVVGGAMLNITMIDLLITLKQLPVALWARRSEQSLLRMLPGAPQGTHLNRWLAVQLAGVYFTTWGLQALVLAFMSAFVGSDAVGSKR